MLHEIFLRWRCQVVDSLRGQSEVWRQSAAGASQLRFAIRTLESKLEEVQGSLDAAERKLAAAALAEEQMVKDGRSLRMANTELRKSRAAMEAKFIAEKKQFVETIRAEMESNVREDEVKKNEMRKQIEDLRTEKTMAFEKITVLEGMVLREKERHLQRDKKRDLQSDLTRSTPNDPNPGDENNVFERKAVAAHLEAREASLDAKEQLLKTREEVLARAKEELEKSEERIMTSEKALKLHEKEHFYRGKEKTAQEYMVELRSGKKADGNNVDGNDTQGGPSAEDLRLDRILTMCQELKDSTQGTANTRSLITSLKEQLELNSSLKAEAKTATEELAFAQKSHKEELLKLKLSLDSDIYEARKVIEQNSARHVSEHEEEKSHMLERFEKEKTSLREALTAAEKSLEEEKSLVAVTQTAKWQAELTRVKIESADEKARFATQRITERKAFESKQIELQQQLQEKTGQFEETREELDGCKSCLRLAEEEVERLRENLNTLKADNFEMAKKISQLERQKALESKKLELCSEHMVAIRSKFETIEDNNRKLREKIVVAESKQLQSDTQLNSIKLEKAEVDRKMVMADHEINRLRVRLGIPSTESFRKSPGKTPTKNANADGKVIYENPSDSKVEDPAFAAMRQEFENLELGLRLAIEDSGIEDGQNNGVETSTTIDNLVGHKSIQDNGTSAKDKLSDTANITDNDVPKVRLLRTTVDMLHIVPEPGDTEVTSTTAITGREREVLASKSKESVGSTRLPSDTGMLSRESSKNSGMFSRDTSKNSRIGGVTKIEKTSSPLIPAAMPDIVSVPTSVPIRLTSTAASSAVPDQYISLSEKISNRVKAPKPSSSASSDVGENSSSKNSGIFDSLFVSDDSNRGSATDGLGKASAHRKTSKKRLEIPGFDSSDYEEVESLMNFEAKSRTDQSGSDKQSTGQDAVKSSEQAETDSQQRRSVPEDPQKRSKPDEPRKTNAKANDHRLMELMRKAYAKSSSSEQDSSEWSYSEDEGVPKESSQGQEDQNADVSGSERERNPDVFGNFADLGSLSFTDILHAQTRDNEPSQSSTKPSSSAKPPSKLEPSNTTQREVVKNQSEKRESKRTEKEQRHSRRPKLAQKEAIPRSELADQVATYLLPENASTGGAAISPTSRSTTSSKSWKSKDSLVVESASKFSERSFSKESASKKSALESELEEVEKEMRSIDKSLKGSSFLSKVRAERRVDNDNTPQLEMGFRPPSKDTRRTHVLHKNELDSEGGSSGVGSSFASDAGSEHEADGPQANARSNSKTSVGSVGGLLDSIRKSTLNIDARTTTRTAVQKQAANDSSRPSVSNIPRPSGMAARTERSRPNAGKPGGNWDAGSFTSANLKQRVDQKVESYERMMGETVTVENANALLYKQMLAMPKSELVASKTSLPEGSLSKNRYPKTEPIAFGSYGSFGVPLEERAIKRIAGKNGALHASILKSSIPALNSGTSGGTSDLGDMMVHPAPRNMGPKHSSQTKGGFSSGGMTFATSSTIKPLNGFDGKPRFGASTLEINRRKDEPPQGIGSRSNSSVGNQMILDDPFVLNQDPVRRTSGFSHLIDLADGRDGGHTPSFGE